MKSLTVAGFSDSQAEAVVETVGTAIEETLERKADLEAAFRPIRSNLDGMVSTKVAKTDLEAVFRSVKADLEYVMSTMVTKTDLAAFEQRMTIKFGAIAFAGMSLLAVLQEVL